MKNQVKFIIEEQKERLGNQIKTTRMIDVSIPVRRYEENGIVIVTTPVFPVSSHGKTAEEAEKAFAKSIRVFLHDLLSKPPRVLKSIMEEFGWKLANETNNAKKNGEFVAEVDMHKLQVMQMQPTFTT